MSGRMDGAWVQPKLTLYRLSDTTKVVTQDDLLDTAHPINDKSVSGKSDGMSVIVNGHTWVATGSEPESPWYRNQKHIENQRAIWRAINNTQATTSVGDESLVASEVDTFIPVESFFTGDWDSTTGVFRLTYTGDECIFQVSISGDVSTTDAAGTGDNISVSVYASSSGDGLTGATKVLPVVKVQGGAVSIVDFTLQGYARVNHGDYFEIQVGSNFAGNLVVNNVLWAIIPLDTLMYI